MRSLVPVLALALLAGCSSLRKNQRAEPGLPTASSGPTDVAPPPGQVSSNVPEDEARGMKDLPVGVAEASADCRARYHKGTLDVPQSELEGVASFYGTQYHGRQTASGEIFDMNKYSAAHRTLRLGTKVRVTNLDNGRSIDVCVNDRGPYAKDRILDLSYAAAKELGVVDEGTAPVRIKILGK